MHWKTTAVLAVLLVGLGTFYYIYEIRQAPDREKAATVKDRLWKDLEAKDIEEVVLRKGAETVHLRKGTDGWTLVAPVAARAEARPVDDLTAALASLRVEREIDASPAKPADYGLAPAAVEVTVKAKGQERAVRLGAKNPTGTWIYAQEAGKPAVFLAPESLLRDTQKGANDFRDRTLLAFERKDVKGLETQGPTGRVEVAAAIQDKDAWALTTPLAVPADREQITGLLDKLRAARIKEFVTDSPKSPAEYGLDKPTRLTLWLGEEKSRAAKRLSFGKVVPDKRAVYAQREGDATVLLVDDELFRAVPTSGATLRDKTVFSYDRGKVERVELESPKGKVILALDGGVWRLTAPAAFRADEGAVNELLWKARDLRAKDFIAEDQKRLATFGLDRPEVRLTMWEKETKEPKTLLLAPSKGAGEKDRAYAAATGPGEPPAVVVVDAKALGDLARSVQDLRDKSFADAFEPKDVTRLQIERKGQTLALERRGTGDDDWQLVLPKKGKARGGRVSELVWALRNLKWKTLVTEQGWDPARYGLDAPAATVTVTGKDGKTLAALALGKEEAGQTFVRVPGQPALYAIETKNLGAVPASPEDLLL